MRYLVEFDRNWADEFDVHGLAIIEASQYQDSLKYAQNVNWYFGTNQGFEDEDLRDSFKIISENEEHIRIIEQTLNFTGENFKTWGNFPNLLDAYYDKIFDQYILKWSADEVFEIYLEDRLIGSSDSIGTCHELIHTDIVKRFPEFSS